MYLKHFWPKDDDENWSRKKYFEIPSCAKLSFLVHKNVYSCKFSNKNYLLRAWRDFNKTFCGVCTSHK